MGKIEDAGVVVPHAKKHQAKSRTSTSTQSSLCLKDLFPEPNWVELVEGGMPIDCAARLAMIYESIRNKPKAAGFGLSQEEWEEAYVQAIALHKAFFERCRTLEDALKFPQWLAKQCGRDVREMHKPPLQEVAVFWAAGRGGSKRALPPGSLTLSKAVMSEALPLLGWPYSDLVIKTGIVPVEIQGGGWFVGRVEGDGITHLSKERFAERGEAVERARAMAQQEVDAIKLLSQGVVSHNQVRRGPDYRQGRRITAEMLMQEFSFRAVQFGESIPQQERQSWLNCTFDAMCDMADVLGMPRKWMGLGGIAIAIGARGQGKASAHYETQLRVVNVTRKRGKGSLGHEWAHALSHRLASRARYTSLFNNVIDPWHDPVLQMIEPVIDDLRNLFSPRARTRFYKQSQAIAATRGGSDYWTEPEEMFARSFEAWLYTKLKELDRRSPYLTPDVDEEIKHAPPGLVRFPVGEDATALFSHIQKLIELISKK